jgi:hypothetical protein
VLHDVTCRTWLLRHIARFLLILLPFAALVVAFLPASLPFRLGCVLVGILGSVVFSFGYTVEGAESRAEKAGYAFGVAAPIREQRAQDAQRATAARLRAKAAARRRAVGQR